MFLFLVRTEWAAPRAPLRSDCNFRAPCAATVKEVLSLACPRFAQNESRLRA